VNRITFLPDTFSASEAIFTFIAQSKMKSPSSTALIGALGSWAHSLFCYGASAKWNRLYSSQKSELDLWSII
jgi:hypothetical protein